MGDAMRHYMTGLRAALGAVALLGLLALPSNLQAGGAPRVLAIGDSLMASHAVSGRSIAHQLGRMIGASVTNRSVLGAHMIYRLPISGAMGLSIPKQFRGTGWDWVIMTGGGNDLWLGCGCGACGRRMNKMISADGTRGEIPRLFQRIRQSGAQVVYVGYLRSPGIATPIEHCKDEGDELEARVARLAARIDGIHYLSNQDLVPRGDTSFFALDGIHPSVKASRAIAGRVAALVQAR
jgi:phospholipase/lecithinase/hemolysin